MKAVLLIAMLTLLGACATGTQSQGQESQDQAQFRQHGGFLAQYVETAAMRR
ncbi:MAG: hypothetical protein K2P81_07240 [Bacteriovoracaceae bacterium]|nr:hypothetical protein [Bacteriovoracaceae bacterium]